MWALDISSPRAGEPAKPRLPVFSNQVLPPPKLSHNRCFLPAAASGACGIQTYWHTRKKGPCLALPELSTPVPLGTMVMPVERLSGGWARD